jgi:hypothetical protein
MKLTTHLQLVLRSRKCGSIHPLPMCLHGIVLSYLGSGTTSPFFHMLMSGCVYVRNQLTYTTENERNMITDF